MKITEQELQIELLKLAGYTVTHEEERWAPYQLQSPGGDCVGTPMYDEAASWGAGPDYPNSLDACFTLAEKLKCNIEMAPNRSEVTGKRRYKWWVAKDGHQVPFPGRHTNPATALSLAILSAHRGERVELEDSK